MSHDVGALGGVTGVCVCGGATSLGLGAEDGLAGGSRWLR